MTEQLQTHTQSVELAYTGKYEPEVIEGLKAELDLTNTNSVISWGTSAQKQVGLVTSQMLEDVKAKDSGEVGELLVSMVTKIRGLDFSKVESGKKLGFIGRLLGRLTPVAEFIQSYETVQSHINTIVNDLESKKIGLMKSVKQLDQLYNTALNYFHDLSNYIVAGQEILDELDNVRIPALKAESENGDILKSQELNDLVNARNAFERRVHDLKLTRTVILQNLPAIRMVQSNDSDLITKIDTQIINTIPAWEMQLAMAVKMFEAAEATKRSKALSDAQNSIIEANAELLRQSNAAARTEIERGAYDIESIKRANENLIGAIEDSIRIATEARQKRAEVSQELTVLENSLKHTLAKAAA